MLVQRLRERRESLGVSQTDLAKLLRWPQQRISAVEAGARRLDIIEYLQLTQSLRMSMTEAIQLAGECLGSSDTGPGA